MQKINGTYKYYIYDINQNGIAVVILLTDSATVFANDIAGREITRVTGAYYSKVNMIFV